MIEVRSPQALMTYLSDFRKGYIEAAFWSSHTDDDTPFEALDEVLRYTSVEDALDDGAGLSIWNDCEAFVAANADDLYALFHAYRAVDAGRDFWFTRNGHGTGFWDRGLGDYGERLTQAAKVYGEAHLVLQDDGQVGVE